MRRGRSETGRRRSRGKRRHLVPTFLRKSFWMVMGSRMVRLHVAMRTSSMKNCIVSALLYRLIRPSNHVVFR
jgi:hypothetical protein